jgi:hypothetical protein
MWSHDGRVKNEKLYLSIACITQEELGDLRSVRLDEENSLGRSLSTVDSTRSLR